MQGGSAMIQALHHFVLSSDEKWLRNLRLFRRSSPRLFNLRRRSARMSSPPCDRHMLASGVLWCLDSLDRSNRFVSSASSI